VTATDPLLVAADVPPRPGLRGDRRLAALIEDLRALWPERPLVLAALSGDGRRASEEGLARLGVQLLTGPCDWAGWLADRAVTFAAVVLHGPLATRRLRPLIEATQPQAPLLADAPALAGGPGGDPRLADGADVLFVRPGDRAAASVGRRVELPDEVAPAAATPGFTARHGALVLASMLEGPGFPDEDAIDLLARDVLPRVRAHLPGFALRVVAEDAPLGLRRLRAEGLEIAPPGADVAAELARARVVVSARRSGPPASAAVLAAAEAGVPVVATGHTAAHHGLPATLTCGPEAWELSDRVRRLSGDPRAWQRARAELAAWASGGASAVRRAALVEALVPLGIAPAAPGRSRAPAFAIEPARWSSASGRRWIAGTVPGRSPRPLHPALPDQVQTEGLRRTGSADEAGRYPTYDAWRRARLADEAGRKRASREIAGFALRPLISVITPVYNTDPAVLHQMIQSVRDQWYPHWELCLVDDASTSSATRKALHRESAFDPRLRAMRRDVNGGISRASNDALAMARGEFVALLDHDDALDPTALFEVVRLLNRCPDLDFIYSDEEKIDEHGVRTAPAHKPSYAPDLLSAGNYMCHLSVYRREVVEAVGSFRSDYDGGQDLDLVLRVVEHTDRIAHIPRPLYAWRMVAGSVATTAAAKPYAYPAGRRAMEDALARRRRQGWVEELSERGTYRVHYTIIGPPRVHALVRAGDDPAELRRFLKEFGERTPAPLPAITVLDGSWRSPLEPVEIERLGAQLRREPGASFPEMVNRALAGGDADLALIIDPRLTIHNPDWLEELVQHAQRPEVGGAAPQLMHPDGLPAAERLFPRSGLGEGWPETRYLWAVPSNHMRVLRNTATLGSACLVLRPAVALEVGGMDERLLDPLLACVDLTLRMRLRGYELISTPYALLTHPAAARGDEPQDPAQMAVLRDRWGLVSGWSDPYHNPNYRAPEAILHVPDAAPAWAGRAPLPAQSLAAIPAIGAPAPLAASEPRNGTSPNGKTAPSAVTSQ
jgi:GT2 family glycosyltransferase